MRLLGHTTTTGGTPRTDTAESWIREYGAVTPAAPKASGKVAAAMQIEIDRLEKANGELRAALAKLIIFAAPRTAMVNECGDRIIDPNVLNAKAALTAVEAGL